MKSPTLFVGLICLSVQILFGQKFPEKGLPPLQNYSPEQYAQAGKAWAIQSAENGLLYLATDKGLLEFDGVTWQLFRGSKGFTRSLLVVNDSLIYSGADKDFGVWRRTGIQDFTYKSTYPFKESTQGLNEEFWGVYQLEDDIIFVSFDNLYVQKGDQLTKISAPTRFYRSFQAGTSLFLADEQEGLFQFDGMSLQPICEFPPQRPLRVMGVADLDSALLLVTRDEGLFLVQNGTLSPLRLEVNPLLKEAQVFSFHALDDSHFAFGTILNGVFITDRSGNVIQHLNKQKGILNNTILSMYFSPQGSLWLGMDFGISSLQLSSDIAYVLDQQGNFGTGQTALLNGTDFYLGTNQGLYTAPWDQLRNTSSEISLRLLPSSAGQVWTLEQIDETVWCGHDQGLFQVEAGRFRPVFTTEGILSILSWDDTQLLTGTYNGLALFEKRNGQWQFSRKIPPVQGACSQVLKGDNQHLWINIPNFGIIQASLDEGLNILDQRFYLTESFEGDNPWLQQEGDDLLLSTSQYRYRYQADADSFLREGRRQDPSPITNRVPNIWSGIQLSESFQFVPVFNGFALYHPTLKADQDQQASVLIRSLMAFNNDTIQSVDDGTAIPIALNNIRVQYLIPHQENGQYRYKLVGFQDEWSNWTTQMSRDFLDLPFGEYELFVEAKTNSGILTAAPLTIEILPPWYRTWYAYLAAILVVLGLNGLQRLRHHRKLRRLEVKLEQKEIQERERHVEVLEHSKMLNVQQRLEHEIDELKKRLRAKTIELAKKGKENDDKSRLLQTLKSKLAAIENRSSEPGVRWKEMSRLLEKKTTLEDHTFELQIDELNQEFLHRLKAEYPTLTTYDLRLATYLRMGLSSREIAELLHVLPSSVNVSRSRLRKKLKLTADKDLYEFLMGV